MVNIPNNDINDGNFHKGEFRPLMDGRQNNYYYGQMRANEYKKFLGDQRVLGNNERDEEHQLDPRIIDTANEIL